MSALFSPLQIRDVTLRNRFVVSPMCQYSSVDGVATDWHLVHLGSFARGGAGLVVVEATAVLPEGRISPDDMGLWNEEQVAPLKRIVDFMHSQGAAAGIQLAHAGRKASTYALWKGRGQVPLDEGGWQTVAPSALPFYEQDRVPAAMDDAAIQQVIHAFVTAAERSLTAGFDVVEIHAAHGYLIHQFLSPLTNKRTDQYGGTFENRVRLLCEIVTAVRNVWPADKPLFVRISATDWTADGWTPDDSVTLAKILQPLGVDLMDCSSGAIAPKIHIPVEPLYQVFLAEKVKKESGMMSGAVGLITTARQAEEIISSGQADLVFMARQMLRDPHFPLRAASELGVDVPWPKQYERGKWA